MSLGGIRDRDEDIRFDIMSSCEISISLSLSQ